MLTQTIRRQFLQYFKQHRHVIVPSSPVLPHDDPTLLFNNAGMNQFKDVFLGKSHRDYNRAASSQKCIRVGGKHNDLENVGHTSRHLTFFEMLGNFSFGDYFKEQAIKFAWEVSTEIFGFEADRIWPSVFREDDEAFDIWRQYVPANRITRLNEADNFWEMGDTGPCGPCSELYYDRGVEFGAANNLLEDNSVGNRFLEFWNLVFMQYNRQASGAKEVLPQPSIDTGAGLERIMSLKMNVPSVFETDVLRDLIRRMEELSGIPYHLTDKRASAFRVIADHLRCLAFAIADGAQPSNVDRGYVLRKVLRRAVRYGRQLGMDGPFLANILPQLIVSMGSDYPELVIGRERIAEILTAEEEAFMRTLKRGGNILNQVMENAQRTYGTISGEDAFKLKDTYGLPIEEILLIAKDYALKVNQMRYEELEVEAKERSRAVHKNVQQLASENVFADFAKTTPSSQFVGYAQHRVETIVAGIVVNGIFVKEMQEGMEGLVILATTPFYAEMGGQVGDIGILENTHNLFLVTNCSTPYPSIIAHHGRMHNGILHVGDVISATIDSERRQKIANNHTATHLLHHALHKLLGEHIKQAGSLVDAEHFRFDFSHHKPLSASEIRQLENLVNTKIRENMPVKSYEMKYDEVQQHADIKQFFGEKYGINVRVIDVGAYSKELCGGTHTSSVGNIGLFRIVKECSIAAGVRRIEAITGSAAEIFQQKHEEVLHQLSERLHTPILQLPEKIDRLLQENEEYVLQLKQIRNEQLRALMQELLKKTIYIAKLNVVVDEVLLSMDELRQMVDLMLDQLKSGIIVLGSIASDKCQLIAKVSDDLVKQGISAHELINLAMPIVEGKGGGKASLAQGGGKAPAKLQIALKNIIEYLTRKASD